MALNLPNFLGAPIVANDYSGLRDALKNFYGGYEMSQAPMKMQNERQNEMLRNALLGAQGRQVGIQNQYLPEQLRLQNALSGQQYQAGEIQQQLAEQKMQQFRDAVERQKARMQHQQEAEQSSQYYNQPADVSIPMRAGYNLPSNPALNMSTQGMPHDRAQPGNDYDAFSDAALIANMVGGDVKYYKSDADGTITGVAITPGMAPVTYSLPFASDVGRQEEQKVLGKARAEEQVAENRAKVERRGRNASLPVGAVDMYSPSVSESERLFFRKQMQENLETARSGVNALKKLDSISAVLDRNPNLYKKLSTIVSLALEGKDEKIIANFVSKNLSNKKDLADVEIFSKNAHDLVIDMAQNFPRSTDALRANIAKSKADPSFTDTANKAIIKQMREQYAGYPGWVDALNDGSELGFFPSPDPKNYINYKSQLKDNQSENFQRSVDDLANKFTLEELRQMEAIYKAAGSR